jgi:hypothetical protein
MRRSGTRRRARRSASRTISSRRWCGAACAPGSWRTSGRVETAEALAREAVALAEQTDLVNFHADALADLAHVVELAERPAEARAILDDALDLYEQKGNVVSASRIQARMDALTTL